MGNYRYFVEGECEKKLLRTYMFKEGKSFVDGKIDVFNFIGEKMSKAYAMTIKRDAMIVIIHDTDVKNVETLNHNINLLQTVSRISKDNLIIVQSIENLEDELVFSCQDIKNINQLLSTNGISEFKKKFISHKDLFTKLESVGFSLNKIWSRQADVPFDIYENQSYRIKKNCR